MKLFVYGVLLPFILLQVAGVWRPVRLTPMVGMPFGTRLKILDSLTTVSGPPLALLFDNEGPGWIEDWRSGLLRGSAATVPKTKTDFAGNGFRRAKARNP